nr:hypothetical protein [Escherichia coli]
MAFQIDPTLFSVRHSQRVPALVVNSQGYDITGKPAGRPCAGESGRHRPPAGGLRFTGRERDSGNECIYLILVSVAWHWLTAQ